MPILSRAVQMSPNYDSAYLKALAPVLKFSWQPETTARTIYLSSLYPDVKRFQAVE
jgi:hypothetical protein